MKRINTHALLLLTSGFALTLITPARLPAEDLEIEERGSMTLVEGYPNVFPYAWVDFDGELAGTLTITNERSGASRRISLRSLESGDAVWSISLDDPSFQFNDIITIEIAGSADWFVLYGGAGGGIVVSGSGYFRCSGTIGY